MSQHPAPAPPARPRLRALRPALRRAVRPLLAGLVVMALLGTLCLPPLAHAGGLGTGIDNFLTDWEQQIQKTSVKPGFYEGQTRGFATGGGLDLRFPVRRPVPLTLSMPSAKAGCGGISWFGGSFSFINMTEFTEYLQAIAQNAMGMAFNMALQTLCPQCATVLNKLEDAVRNVTGKLKDSCGMSKMLLNSIPGVDNLNEVAQQTCGAINTVTGQLPDWLSSQQECSKIGKVADSENRGIQQYFNDPNRLANLAQPPIFTSGNVFWTAYNAVKGTLPEYDDNFGEELMSLFGTYIVDLRTDNGTAPQSKERILSVYDLLNGWDAGKPIYRCQDPDLGDRTEFCFVAKEVGATAAYLGMAAEIRTKLEQFVTDLNNRTLGSGLGPYLTADVAGMPIMRLLIDARNVEGATDRITGLASRWVAMQLLQVYVRQLAQQIQSRTYQSPDRGKLEPFLRQFRDARNEIDREFDLVERSLTDGLRNMRTLVELYNGSSGTKAAMLARHTFFSNQQLKGIGPGPMGR